MISDMSEILCLGRDLACNVIIKRLKSSETDTFLRRGSCYEFKQLSDFEARDSGSKGNKYTKERLCGGE